jgi:hypothetical protein
MGIGQNPSMDDQLTDDPGGARFVPLTRVSEPFLAGILAARLRSEGIDVRLHSEAFGPYPVTVGEMAQTEIWVLDDRVDEASRILIEVEAQSTVERSDPDREIPESLPEVRVVAVVVGFILLLTVVFWLVQVY